MPKKYLIGVAVISLIGLGGYYFYEKNLSYPSTRCPSGVICLYPLKWSSHVIIPDQESGVQADWPTAMDFCSSLVEGGYSDWRLPTYLELINTATNQEIFIEGFSPGSFWSSTEVLGWVSASTGLPLPATHAYEVFFPYATGKSNSKTETVNVRCVRDLS